MSSHLDSLVFELLSSSAAELQDELLPLVNLFISDEESYAVSHDGHECLLVYAPERLLAYVPKKFNGWEIHFIPWDGDENVILDIEQQLLF